LRERSRRSCHSWKTMLQMIPEALPRALVTAGDFQ
jgi:hypothetical protein